MQIKLPERIMSNLDNNVIKSFGVASRGSGNTVGDARFGGRVGRGNTVGDARFGGYLPSQAYNAVHQYDWVYDAFKQLSKLFTGKGRRRGGFKCSPEQINAGICSPSLAERYVETEGSGRRQRRY